MPQRRIGAHAKLLANYASDDAIIAAGEAAELLFVRALAFCANSDSDGYVTDAQLVRFVGAGMRDAVKRAAALVREGLWERVDGGYVVRSWLKINPSSEEKGYKRKTDRERKRTPQSDGIRDDSTRKPDGIVTDSESEGARNPCNELLSKVPTVPDQYSSDQFSAGIPPQAARGDIAVIEPDRPTAQTIVAEWLDHCQKRPPGQVIGQVAKSIDRMLAEGVASADVRRGIAAWHTKGLSPVTLPAVVNEVMNAPPPGKSRQQQQTDDLFDRAARRMGVIA